MSIQSLDNNEIVNLDDKMGSTRIDKLFELQKQRFSEDPYPDYLYRLESLKKLYAIIDNNSDAICKALSADFACRSVPESLISDVTGSLSSIRYLIKNLKRFMRSQKRKTSIWYLPGNNKVTPLPLGVIGIMSPWNYPVHLTIAPVAAALAAGNRVMAKMSEFTPNTSELMQSLIQKNFPEDTLTIITGEVEISAHFSSLPFEHLMFTGSTAVGKKIAQNAAKNLTPLTLELSGKSPAIVTRNYDINEAAKRITWGKVFNSGQTCVAPDYAFVPEDQLIEFIRGCRTTINDFYPDGIDVDSYTSVINRNHYQRLCDLIDDAKAHGAEVIQLSDTPESENKLPLTLVINPDRNCKIYSEEIFGPILSVFTYDSLDDAINTIRKFEDPLAMYVFSRYDAEARYISKYIRAAGISINDTLLHYLQNDLPFGGRGNTGYGKYHGREGFETFSHMQPVFKQRGLGTFTGLKLLYPPYGAISGITAKLIRLLP